MKIYINIVFCMIILISCKKEIKNNNTSENAVKEEREYIIISRKEYKNQLYGFWLGQSIANWTGLVTEMDKIGGEGKNGQAAGFYTRENWGQPDELNLWGFSDVSDTITFVFEEEGGIWGADDDTDIEYIYQHLLYENKTTQLTGQQIRDGWLKHIYDDKAKYHWCPYFMFSSYDNIFSN